MGAMITAGWPDLVIATNTDWPPYATA